MIKEHKAEPPLLTLCWEWVISVWLWLKSELKVGSNSVCSNFAEQPSTLCCCCGGGRGRGGFLLLPPVHSGPETSSCYWEPGKQAQSVSVYCTTMLCDVLPTCVAHLSRISVQLISFRFNLIFFFRYPFFFLFCLVFLLCLPHLVICFVCCNNFLMKFYILTTPLGYNIFSRWLTSGTVGYWSL